MKIVVLDVDTLFVLYPIALFPWLKIFTDLDYRANLIHDIVFVCAVFAPLRGETMFMAGVVVVRLRFQSSL